MAGGSGQDARSAGAGSVVICCASADMPVIAPVVSELEAEGHAVELVAGVEGDPELLASAIERCHEEGLYVLCRSPALGRDVVDALRDVLLAHHVPFGRTLTVTSTRPQEVRERIGVGLQKVAGARAQPMTRVPVEGRPPADTRRRMTQYGMPAQPPPVEAKSPGPPPPPRPRRATQLGIPVGRLLGDDPPTVRIPSSARQRLAPSDDSGGDFDEPEETRQMRAPEAEALAAVDAAAARARSKDVDPGDEGDFSPEDSLGSISLIKPEDLEDLAHTGPHPRVELDASNLENKGGIDVPPPPAGLTGETVVAAAPQRPHPPPAAPLPRSTTIAVPTTGAARTERSMGMWVGVGLGVLALALVGGLLASLAGDDEEEDTELADARDSTTSKEAQAAPSSRDTAPEDATLASDGKIQMETPQSEARVPGQTRTRVMEALRARKVRALDILLITPGAKGPMPHAEALAHCDGLSIDGLDGWRLPTIGELTSMTRAEMLGRGYYWSATAADTFGDTHWAWYGRRDRPVQRTDKSFVVCVRGQPAAG